MIKPSSRGTGPSAAWRRWWPVKWFRARVLEPTLTLLERGAEPKQLALSLALGFTIGICPLCGLTAAFCGLAAVLLRSQCHVPTLMVANFAAWPVELSLIIPYMRLGELVMKAPAFSVAPEALVGVLQGKASHRILVGLCHSVLGWALTFPLVIGGLYQLCLPLMRGLRGRASPPFTSRPSVVAEPSPPANQNAAANLAYSSNDADDLTSSRR